MRHEPESRRTAVLLDPQPLCHVAVRSLLAAMAIDLVGATPSVGDAHSLLREHQPDLLVLEVDLPGGREQALGLIERACVEEPRLTVVVLSETDDRRLVDAAFERGARAYVLKSSELAHIRMAISQAFEPTLYLARPERSGATAALEDVLRRKLTRREVEILRLVSGGRSNHDVAKLLWVTDETVKFHLANVYRKLGVHSRFEAARWARRHGLAELTEASNVVPLERGGTTRSADPHAQLRGPRHGNAAGARGSRGNRATTASGFRRVGTPRRRGTEAQPPARRT